MIKDIRKYLNLLSEADDNIIQFPKQPNKIEKLAKEIPNLFAYQDYAEKLIKQKINDIKHSSESYNAKYKNPTVMAEYQKGIDPMRAWSFDMHWSLDPYYLKDTKYKFISEEGLKFVDDFIRIAQDQIAKIKELYNMPELKQMPAPQYAVQNINSAVSEYDRDLDLFYEFKTMHDPEYIERLKTGSEKYHSYMNNLIREYKLGNISIEDFKAGRDKKKQEIESRYNINIDRSRTM